ncbi:hypothetical protein SAMN05428996_2038 [Quadrisphaera sp. DSM 44207]|nr:hypothetical protein SAMN05428996_2038 [Quadrisphaera sp. DSM 44207]
MPTSRRGRTRAHPRVRGEHRGAGRMTTVSMGSSPRTRGAPLESGWGANRIGLIPAYAGSTPRRGCGGPRQPAHPRVRGEHRAAIAAADGWLGSSPRTRGAQGRRHACGDEEGLIPAYAGSTTASPSSPDGPWAHPRVRGEHVAQVLAEKHLDGSSPRTRGALAPLPRGAGVCGLIPAYAGSTTTTRSRSARCRAHPRVRGEHSARGGADLRPRGSSPRTRGARRAVSDGQCGGGLIPVYAGSTACSGRSPRTRTAHPRVRGEHSNLARDRGFTGGSSPRTRGAPFHGGARV